MGFNCIYLLAKPVFCLGNKNMVSLNKFNFYPMLFNDKNDSDGDKLGDNLLFLEVYRDQFSNLTNG